MVCAAADGFPLSKMSPAMRRASGFCSAICPKSHFRKCLCSGRRSLPWNKLPRCQSLVANIFILIRMYNLSVFFISNLQSFAFGLQSDNKVGTIIWDTQGNRPKNEELWMEKWRYLGKDNNITMNNIIEDFCMAYDFKSITCGYPVP